MKPRSNREKLLSFSLPMDFLPTLNYKMEVNVNRAGWMCKNLYGGIRKVGFINGGAIEEEFYDEIFSMLMAVR